VSENGNSELDADISSALQGSDADDSEFYDRLALAAYRDEDSGLPANTDPNTAHAVGDSWDADHGRVP
jgi:hypothetical protein